MIQIESAKQMAATFLSCLGNTARRVKRCGAARVFSLNSSVSAAHACAGQSISSQKHHEYQTRSKATTLLSKVSPICKKTPGAKLRRCLNTAIIPLIQKGHVDLEVIEAIFDAAVKVFSEYSHHEAAKTALAVLTYQAVGGEQYATIKNRFSRSQRERPVNREKLSQTGKTCKKPTNTSDAFAALAGALQSKRSAKLNSQIHTLIVDYVSLRSPRCGGAPD